MLDRIALSGMTSGSEECSRSALQLRSTRTRSVQREKFVSFLHPRQSCLGRFGFVAFGQNAVGSDDEMIFIHQFDFCAPAPVWSAVGIGKAAEDEEAVLGRGTHA